MSNPRGRPTKRKLVVSPEQKATLQRLVQQPRNSRSIAFRARVILECASGQNNAAVAAKLRYHRLYGGDVAESFYHGGGLLSWATKRGRGPRARSVTTGSSRRYVSL